jgi:hypothetical protein
MKKFSEEAVVRIWANRKILGTIPTRHFGHASLSLRSDKFLIDRDNDYISWWPGDDGANINQALRWQDGSPTEVYAGDKYNEMSETTAKALERGYQAQQKGKPLPRGAFSPLPGQKRREVYNDNTGVNDVFWLQSADAKINLPGIDAKDTNGKSLYWGLSTTRMCSWWKTWMPANKYRLASATHNCAGVVGLALEAGGAAVFVKRPSVTIYMEPLMIQSWARELETQLAHLNNVTAAFDDVITEHLNSHPAEFTSLKHPPPQAGELWTTSQWKEASALSWKPRSSLLQHIDSALERYQSLTWKDPQFIARLKALLDLVQALSAHRQAKEDSERGVAVCALGKQALMLLKKPETRMKLSNH